MQTVAGHLLGDLGEQRLSAALHQAATAAASPSMAIAWPGTWTWQRSRAAMAWAPRKTGTPTKPSLPMVAISILEPSSMVVSKEITAPCGK